MKRFFLAVFLCLLWGATPGHTHEVKGPKGPVILTVTGNIHHNNRGASSKFQDAFFAHHEKKFNEAFVFDRAALLKLAQYKIKAHAESWQNAVLVEGPKLMDVLSKTGALGQKFRFTALDGYAAELSLKELDAHNWIVALRADGKPLGLGGRGPLWLVFETKDGKASKQEEAKWVWSLFLIEVE